MRPEEEERRRLFLNLFAEFKRLQQLGKHGEAMLVFRDAYRRFPDLATASAVTGITKMVNAAEKKRGKKFGKKEELAAINGVIRGILRQEATRALKTGELRIIEPKKPKPRTKRKPGK